MGNLLGPRFPLHLSMIQRRDKPRRATFSPPFLVRNHYFATGPWVESARPRRAASMNPVLEVTTKSSYLCLHSYSLAILRRKNVAEQHLALIWPFFAAAAVTCVAEESPRKSQSDSNVRFTRGQALLTLISCDHDRMRVSRSLASWAVPLLVAALSATPAVGKRGLFSGLTRLLSGEQTASSTSGARAVDRGSLLGGVSVSQDEEDKLGDAFEEDLDLNSVLRLLDGDDFSVVQEAWKSKGMGQMFSDPEGLRTMLDAMPMLKAFKGVDAIAAKDTLTPEDVSVDPCHLLHAHSNSICR